MDFIGKKWFKFHSDFNQFELGFLRAREYGLLFCLLQLLSDKGSKSVVIDKRELRCLFGSSLCSNDFNSVMLGLKDKLSSNGYIGSDNKALFSHFEFGYDSKNAIKTIGVSISQNKLYLFNNVKNRYTAIDMVKFQLLSSFSAKVVYCWIRWFRDKGEFFVKADKLLSVLGIDISDSCNLAGKFKRIERLIKGVGYNLAIIKEKKGIDKRRISALKFKFSEMVNNEDKTNQVITKTPMISEVATNKLNQAKTPTPIKENDAITRFKNRFKTPDNAKTSPTITPTPKNADNKPTQANNESLTNFENIVLTSPKYFDYKIISVTKGSLYYEIKAFCDLKKKHELIKLLVAEYSNPLDHFFKQGYKFKHYQKQESDADFDKYIHKMVSLIHSDNKYGDIYSYLKIMRIFKRYDDKIQVELKDVDKEGVVIKPFIADNSAHLSAWFNKYQFGSY